MNTFNHFFNEAFTFRDEEEFFDMFADYHSFIKGAKEELPKQFASRIIKEASEAEKRGQFGIVRGPEVEIYYAPADFQSRGAQREAITVCEQHVNGEVDCYAIHDADLSVIEDLWREGFGGAMANYTPTGFN